jgi:hypothetical protein
MADLPAPPAFTFKNVVAVIGPGTIALSMSIGAGEWLLGPTNVVKYGFGVMWIVTLGILFQLVFNLEAIRYTVYTGEPAVNGFMRTKPGPGFWVAVYLVLALCQVGWPAWAANSAATIFGAFSGRVPGDGDKTMMLVLGTVPFLLTVVIVAFGGKVERMLEWVNKIMVVVVVTFLVVMCVLFVKAQIWWDAFVGHFKFFNFPKDAQGNINWYLLAALAGFAANGGIGNIWTTNWIRDKGYGMGSVVGYIPSAVGGKVVHVSPIGTVFPPTSENMSRWKGWWKFVHMDQSVVWMVGCFLGMYLNVILAYAIIEPGTNLTGQLGAGAAQAEGLRKLGGQFLWFLTLLNGFWILFGTQLCIVDGFVRLCTDMLWTASAGIRNAARGDIRRVYYGLLLLFAVWGSVAIHLARPAVLAVIAANAAAFILVVGGIHVLILNHRYLPREVRGPLWIRAALVLTVAFYAFFSLMSFGQTQGWWGEGSAGGH